uniref:Uncharacterized protein n=1 Tax=Arundo donax TaxID=35708 RepID=A0A0A9G9S6_ARUDO
MIQRGRIRSYETLAYKMRFLKAASANLLKNEQSIIFQEE